MCMATIITTHFVLLKHLPNCCQTHSIQADFKIWLSFCPFSPLHHCEDTHTHQIINMLATGWPGFSPHTPLPAYHKHFEASYIMCVYHRQCIACIATYCLLGCLHVFSLVSHESSISTEIWSHIIDMLYTVCVIGFFQHQVVNKFHVLLNCIIVLCTCMMVNSKLI